MRIVMRIAYDGTDFCGWARQPDLRSIQETVETAINMVLRLAEPVRTIVAGRTDAGVHARDQWVHFDVPADVWERVADRAIYRLRGVMPRDIQVLSVAVAPVGFDARFSPLWRRYAYRICDDPAGIDPLRRREVLLHHRQLNVAAMHEAAQPLLGQQDFAAYCRHRAGATTIRGLQRLDVTRQGDGLVRADLVADAFCHSMVRSLMGALIAVGDGRKDLGWPLQILTAAVRDPNVPAVAARGLVLEEVAYPEASELAARAELTRARRTLETLGEN
jgi:tRNA pseudouridine38-40 synthase